jgi:hypothetical protein
LEFSAAPLNFQRPLLLTDSSDKGVLILSGKLSMLSTTFVQSYFPKSVLVEVSISFSSGRLLGADYIQKFKTELKNLPL